VRSRVRRLTSVFGEVEVERDGYSARQTCSLFPVDGALNLPRESYSLGLRRLVAVEAAKVSYDEVAAAVAERTGVSVPKRQLEELVRRTAIDFDDFYERRAPAANTPNGELLVLSTDGKGISMRRDDLREATRKAAERRRPKLEKRACKGEKTATRRMAQVAAVYTIEPFVRTPEQIVQTLGPAPAEATPQARPRPQNKRVWACVGSVYARDLGSRWKRVLGGGWGCVGFSRWRRVRAAWMIEASIWGEARSSARRRARRRRWLRSRGRPRAARRSAARASSVSSAGEAPAWVRP
jgi:hypothetical protein